MTGERRWHLTAALLTLALVAATVPAPAYASNCSDLSDCWDTIAAAVLVTVALAAILAIGIAVLPAIAVEAAEVAEVAEMAEVAAEAGEAAEATEAAELGEVLAKDAAELSHEAYGPAAVNNAAEYEQIVSDLESSGAEINFNPEVKLGQGAYGPASTPGSPGTLTVNPDVDISTLGHEYEHFVMDRELGYPGMRGYMENPQLMVDSEIRAYDTEIARANVAGNSELADALETAKQATIDGIRERFGL